MKTLAVKPVRNGKGIVALKPFRLNAIIFEIQGKIVTPKTVWGYWGTDPRLGENCYRYSAERYLNPEGEIGQYVNHSCDPNAGLVKQGRRLWLKAIAPVAPGEEITFDYSTQIGDDDVWEMRCNCGAANCRRRVRNISTLPAAVLKRYRRLGVVPEFIYAGR